MNILGLNLSNLATRLKSVLFDPLLPVPSREKHEEYLGTTARNIMQYQGEGNVLLAAGQVSMGESKLDEKN